MYVASGLVGLALSYVVTMVAWNFIEPLMFRCWDDVPFILIAESIDTHRLAGDKLCPGWTWEEAKMVKLIYWVSFLSLWFAIAAAPRWLRRNATRESLGESVR
jgi:hypothetical protein